MSALLLEDPLYINFTLVGTREWLRASIPAEDKHRYQYIVVDRHEDLNPLGRYLDAQPILGWDTETTGDQNRPKDGLHAHSKTSRMILFQIGTKDYVYLVEPELLRRYPHFKYLMEKPDILHLAQNEVFDFKMILAKYGIHPLNLWCTMLAEQVLTAGRRGVGASLRHIVRRYPPYRTLSKEVRDEFTTFSGVFSFQQLYYSARDVRVLFDALPPQQELLKAYRLQAIANIEFNCIPITAEMELGGLDIDTNRLQQTIEYNQRKADELAREIFRLYNEELNRRHGTAHNGLFEREERFQVFKLKSPPDKKLALARIGIEVPNTDNETLEMLDHPIGPMISKWMNYDKVISTYGQRLIDMVHPDTGRMHPRFLQMGEGEYDEIDKNNSSSSGEKGTTATGRFTSNAQQFPKEKKVYDKITDPQLLSELRSHFKDRIEDLASKYAKAA